MTDTTKDWKDAERWRYFADAAEKERSSNGDNLFVRYVGPWVVSHKVDYDDDGHRLHGTETPDEWIDAAVEENDAARAPHRATPLFGEVVTDSSELIQTIVPPPAPDLGTTVTRFRMD